MVLGVGKGALGTWAIVAPGSFYSGFPALGGRAVSLSTAYSEHLVTELGAAMLAVAAFVLLAGVGLERWLVQSALVAVLLQGLPHLGYHLNAFETLASLDGLLLVLSLVCGPAFAVYLLMLSRELTRRGAV